MGVQTVTLKGTFDQVPTHLESSLRGLNARVDFEALTARLKSCPDLKDDHELLQIHGWTGRSAILVLILCFE